jgi:hypothetical protein
MTHADLPPWQSCKQWLYQVTTALPDPAALQEGREHAASEPVMFWEQVRTHRQCPAEKEKNFDGILRPEQDRRRL